MKFAILDSDYPEFLEWLYTEHPLLGGETYAAQQRVRVQGLFGTADFYSSNLRQLGHEAVDLFANNEWMQRAWAREHGLEVEEAPGAQEHWQALWQGARRLGRAGVLRHVKPLVRPLTRAGQGRPRWLYTVLGAQLKQERPDVLLNQDMAGIDLKFLREIRPYVGLLVGQHAATPLPGGSDWSCYDLVLSSFEPTVAWCRQRGIPAALVPLAFEARVAGEVEPAKETVDVSFIGSFQAVHHSRLVWLEALCRRFPGLGVWAPRVDHLPRTSPIRACYRGQAWGRQMYQRLAGSRITLNHHGDVPAYANNYRLYEATGAGTLLVTDWKPNLPQLFEVGREVVAYRSLQECGDAIAYYSSHEAERRAVADAGRRRTLRQHTYAERMRDMADIIQGHLRTWPAVS